MKRTAGKWYVKAEDARGNVALGDASIISAYADCAVYCAAGLEPAVAQRICEAVNSHDALVAEVAKLREALAAVRKTVYDGGPLVADNVYCIARAALAEGKCKSCSGHGVVKKYPNNPHSQFTCECPDCCQD